MTYSSIEEKISFQKEVNYEPRRKNRSRYTLLQNENQPKNVLIHDAAYVLTADARGRFRARTRQSILIQDGKIVDVFDSKKKNFDLNDVDLIYNAGVRGGVVVTPGFVNTHSHPPMYLLRSLMLLESNESMREALAQMADLEGKMTLEDYYIAAVGDLTEQQKSGITTTLSHYGVFDPIEAAAEKSGQRVINALSCASNTHPENTPALVEKYLKRKSGGTTPAIALHYVYRASPALLKKIKRMQDKYGVLLTMHLAESPHVVEECYKKFGMSEVHTLEKFGLLSDKLILSHVVHCTEDEIKLLIKRRVGISHLPTSNVLHKNGTFRLNRWAKFGGMSRISLGTDSVVSKNRLDLLTEALQTRIMHRYRRLVKFEDLFKMMTVQAGQVLGRNDLGRIAKGYRADLSFWKLKDRGFLPFDADDPKTLLGNMITHGGRNIRDLMIDGRFVISNRVHNLVHESNLIVQLQERHHELRKRIK